MAKSGNRTTLHLRPEPGSSGEKF